MSKSQKVSFLPRLLWLLAILFGFVILLIFTGPLWRSLLVSGLVAYLLNPVISRLEKRLRLSHRTAAVITFLLLLLLLASLIYAASSIIVNQAPTLSQELHQAWSEILVLLERPFTILNFTIQPQVWLAYVQRAASNAATSLPAASGGWLGGLADNLIWSLVMLVSLYYLMRDGQKIVPDIIDLLPDDYQQNAKELARELDSIWRIFLRAQIIIFLVLGVLIIASTGLILWLFRQGWLPLSPVGLVVLLIVVYVAIQQVDNLWLRPQFMGQALKLHPGVVIVSLLAALAFTGLLGALLIVPVLASLKVIFQYFRAHAAPLTPIARPNKLIVPPEEVIDSPVQSTEKVIQQIEEE